MTYNEKVLDLRQEMKRRAQAKPANELARFALMVLAVLAFSAFVLALTA